jgi:hypothetical protein
VFAGLINLGKLGYTILSLISIGLYLVSLGLFS